jgi:hypothetical protein
MHGEMEMRKILEYTHGTSCYMKENNIKIDRKNYCFKLGLNLSSFGQCFCVHGNESSVKKGPSCLINCSNIALGRAHLDLAYRWVNEFMADAESMKRIVE